MSTDALYQARPSRLSSRETRGEEGTRANSSSLLSVLFSLTRSSLSPVQVYKASLCFSSLLPPRSAERGFEEERFQRNARRLSNRLNGERDAARRVDPDRTGRLAPAERGGHARPGPGNEFVSPPDERGINPACPFFVPT